MRTNKDLPETSGKANSPDMNAFIELVTNEIRLIKGTSAAFDPTVANLVGIYNDINKDHNKSMSFDTNDWLQDATRGFKCILTHNMQSSNIVRTVVATNGKEADTGLRIVDANTIEIYSATRFVGRCVINTGYFGLTSALKSTEDTGAYKEFIEQATHMQVEQHKYLNDTRVVKEEAEDIVNKSTKSINFSLRSCECIAVKDIGNGGCVYDYTYPLAGYNTAIVSNVNDPYDQIVSLSSYLKTTDGATSLNLRVEALDEFFDDDMIVVTIIVNGREVLTMEKEITTAEVQETANRLFLTTNQKTIIENDIPKQMEVLEALVTNVRDHQVKAMDAVVSLKNQLGLRPKGKLTSDAIENGIFTRILSIKEYNRFKSIMNDLDVATQLHTSITNRFESLENRLTKVEGLDSKVSLIDDIITRIVEDNQFITHDVYESIVQVITEIESLGGMAKFKEILTKETIAITDKIDSNDKAIKTIIDATNLTIKNVDAMQEIYKVKTENLISDAKIEAHNALVEVATDTLDTLKVLDKKIADNKTAVSMEFLDHVTHYHVEKPEPEKQEATIMEYVYVCDLTKEVDTPEGLFEKNIELIDYDRECNIIDADANEVTLPFAIGKSHTHGFTLYLTENTAARLTIIRRVMI